MLKLYCKTLVAIVAYSLFFCFIYGGILLVPEWLHVGIGTVGLSFVRHITLVASLYLIAKVICQQRLKTNRLNPHRGWRYFMTGLLQAKRHFAFCLAWGTVIAVGGIVVLVTWQVALWQVILGMVGCFVAVEGMSYFLWFLVYRKAQVK